MQPSFWLDRAAFIGRPWAHALILHLHDHHAWPRPSLERLSNGDRKLVWEMLAAWNGRKTANDPEFARLADELSSRTRVDDALARAG